MASAVATVNSEKTNNLKIKEEGFVGIELENETTLSQEYMNIY